jgi:hypothetical protein
LNNALPVVRLVQHNNIPVTGLNQGPHIRDREKSCANGKAPSARPHALPGRMGNKVPQPGVVYRLTYRVGGGTLDDVSPLISEKTGCNYERPEVVLALRQPVQEHGGRERLPRPRRPNDVVDRPMLCAQHPIDHFSLVARKVNGVARSAIH